LATSTRKSLQCGLTLNELFAGGGGGGGGATVVDVVVVG
jgi:hypothetical protein